MGLRGPKGKSFVTTSLKELLKSKCPNGFITYKVLVLDVHTYFTFASGPVDALRKVGNHISKAQPVPVDEILATRL